MFLFRPFAYWRELCGIGFFIVWHWQILDISLDAKQSFFPGELGDSIHLFFFVSLTFLVLFLLECRVPPCFYRAGHDWLASTATLCMFSLLFSLPLVPQKEYSTLSVLVLVVSGAGSAIMLLAWLHSLVAIPYRSIISIIGGSFVFSTGINSFIHFHPATAMALCVISLSMSRFLLPHVQQLFGIVGLLAIVFLKLPLEKDIYQAFLLVVPFLLCGYAAWPILHSESPGLSLVGLRLGFGLLAVYLFVAVSAMSTRLQKNKKKKLYACLGYMYLAFWAGSQVCSLHFFGVYGIQELDILFIFLLIVLLSSCGACTFWLYQARCSIQYIEKTSQKNNILINFFMSKGLTHQQSIISILLSQKISEDIICDILSISPLTLETHIRNILKRMNINSKYELIYIIRQNNKTIMPYDNK